MKTASPVGSEIGSLANGVTRFSRLLTAQGNADPDALTIVPNSGLASTFDHGSGVSRSPSSVRMYSRPSGVNPPRPLSMTRGGIGTTADAGVGAGGAAVGGTSSGPSHGAG